MIGRLIGDDGKNVWVGDKSGGNYVGFDNRGNMTFYGEATKWDDLRFPAQRQRQGATGKPDFDYTNIGLLFPQDDPTEIVYMIGQMPHTWKEGSTVYPHVHYIQEESDGPTFKLDYRFYNVGADVPGSFTTITLDVNHALPWSTNDMHQIAKPSVGISMTGLTLSCIMDMRLYRDDDVVTGDVLGKEFDVHFEIDSMGSDKEYIK